MNLENHNYDKVKWNGYDLYIENFKARYQLELKRNRDDRIKVMQTYMAAHDMEKLWNIFPLNKMYLYC